jgi:hypothetical protein
MMLPRLTRQQIEAIAKGVVEGRIFSTDETPLDHFLPIALSAWIVTKTERKGIGAVYATKEDRLANGTFWRCRLVSKADWARVRRLVRGGFRKAA